MDLISSDSLEVDFVPRYRKCNAKLERVIGCTASSRCSIAVDQHKGLIAYPAGSTVVLQNPNTGAQAHLIGTTKNNITCLAFSKCGGYLATGECGHEPRIRVWQLYDTNGQFCFNQLTDIKYHQIGIVCVRFTHEDKYILSIGNRHDKAIAIWDWRTKMKIAENRLTSKINSVDENEQGVYVTVGMRHVKFWHIALNTKSDRQMPLQGRSAILADHRNNTFVDVCCVSNNRTFSITETKMLVEFNDKKLVNTYDLNGEVPHSLVGGNNELFIGFNNGTIRCFDTDTVEHKRTYCKPHHFLCDIARGVSADALLPTSHPADARYPDVRALCYNKRTDVMTVVYSDRSIYNWKHIPNTDSYSKLSSQLFHVGSILSLEVYSNVHSFLPFGTFITGGVDETIRLWNVDQKINQFDQAYSSSLPPTNVYSEDLKKIIYLANANNSLTEAPEQVLAPSMDLKVGAKSLRVSPDGQHLACGGRDGNLRVYDLTLPDTPMVTICEAHEAEIMCLEYSDPERCDHYLLASGSRDRLVHLFDPRSDYTPLTTIDDNHSTINSIVFTTVISGTSENLARDFCLITCAADRVITVHKLLDTAESSRVTFKRSNQMKAQFGLNHMLLSGDTLLTACQDRLLRSFGFNGKVVKQIKGTSTDDGQLTKVRLDPSGTYAATVCSDRNVYIVEASTGDCAAVLSGQSDSVTDVAFTNDCKRLIVVSYSGCIFVWRLSNLLSIKMAENLKKVSAGSTVATNQLSTASTIADRPETPDSLLGGTSSDAASERHQIAVQRTIPSKAKDSESDFGSLNSVRIADEDDDNDSCLAQKPAKVVLTTSTEEQHNFEIKRTATEVVRRSNSGLLNQQNTAWDIASTANDFSDDEMFVGTDQAQRRRGGTEGGEQPGVNKRIGMSNTYTSSRSMSNLRPPPNLGMSSTPPTAMDSPRRPRKKWDMSGDSAVGGYISPAAHQQNQNIAAPSLPPHSQIPSGFMTMNGTHIYTPTPYVKPGANAGASPVVSSSVPSTTAFSQTLPRPHASSQSQPSHQQYSQYQNPMMVSPPQQISSGSMREGIPLSTIPPPPQVSNHTNAEMMAILMKQQQQQHSTNNNQSSNLFNRQSDDKGAATTTESFTRTSAERNSLSKRYILNSPVAASTPEPRTIWTPASITARRSASNMQFSSAHYAAANSIQRRQSESPGSHSSMMLNPTYPVTGGSGGRLYQQNTSALLSMMNTSDDSSGGGSIGRRSSRHQRTMHRLKNRRITIANIEQQQQQVKDTDKTSTNQNDANSNNNNNNNSIATMIATVTAMITDSSNDNSKSPSHTISRQEDDYTTSDLHLRSRSQSPSHLALNTLNDDYLRKSRRQDSDMSTYSNVTMTSTRITPSSSRTNLRAVGVGASQHSSAALSKLNEMRDRLRKSQENLAMPIGDESGLNATSLHMSRSRSIGNLRFSTAPQLSASQQQLTSAANAPTPNDPTATMPGADFETKPESLMRNRQIARSVGNLNNSPGAQQAVGDSADESVSYTTRRAPTRLAQTIEKLKKASNPDLTQIALSEDSTRAPGEDIDTEPYYSSATLPRNQRGKGAVQKRVERYHPGSRISRDTTSGESDSNASDLNCSPLLQSANIANSQIYAKRYFSPSNGAANRSVSSVEGMPRPGTLQSARRIFEQQRHGSTGVMRRAPNYLAQKLACGDVVGPDMGAEECPHPSLSPNDPSTSLPDFDSKSSASKQMAKHVKECVRQFNTGLDMVLQGRQMVESSQLPIEDKEQLLKYLNQHVTKARKRLEITDDRYEPDGGRSDSPNSISSQRPNPLIARSPSGESPQQHHQLSTNPQLTTSANNGTDVDLNSFLQQHRHQLVALLEKNNMAKQN